MNDHSSAHSTLEYQPTIIENGLLISRLVVQIAFLNKQLKQALTECKDDPVAFFKQLKRNIASGIRSLVSTPNAVPAILTAVAAIACVVTIALLIDRTNRSKEIAASLDGEGSEIVMLNVAALTTSPGETHVGKDGHGRVGFNKDRGEGSAPTPERSGGGGSGGNGNPNPSQTGKIRPSSNILAAIPTAPPVHPPALPVAGVDIDPALWKDLKAPVYGDPNSSSNVESKGPGAGEGIGTNNGLGIGPGNGPGVGPGNDGNLGGGNRQIGCCGPGSGSNGEEGSGRTFTGREVEQ